MKSPKKFFALVSLVGALLLIVGACGGSDPTAAPAPKKSVAAPATQAPAATPLPPQKAEGAGATKSVVRQQVAQPAPTVVPAATLADPIRGGTLLGAQHLTIRGMDPLLNVCTGTCSINRPFFNKLVSVNKGDGATAEGELATDWSTNADGTVFTFNLRQGVKFHDGSTFSAEDVIHSIDRIQNPEKFEAMGAPRNLRDTTAMNLWSIVEKAEAIDDYTVRITLSKFSDTWFTSMLTVRGTFYAVPSDVSQEVVNKAATGTGPYTLDYVKFDEKIKMFANPNYWNTDDQGRSYPYLDGAEIFIIKDSSALLAAFTTGQVIWERPVSANRVAGRQEELRGQIPGLQIAPLASSLNSVFLNNRNAALRDVRVRQAIDLALNRHAVNQAATKSTALVYHGVGIPPELNGTWSLPTEMFKDRPGYHLDPAKRANDITAAQDLMRAAGFSKDNPLELKVVGRNSSVDELTVTMDSLRDVWIVPDSNGIVDTGSSDRKVFLSNDWDLSWYFFFSGEPYPGFSMRDQFSSRANDMGQTSNDWDYSDVDPLWVQFDATGDRAKQQEIVNEIQTIFLEKLYLIPAYRTALFHSWWPALRNVPRTQCCTVADVVEDFEGFWIDRSFQPYFDFYYGYTEIYSGPK